MSELHGHGMGHGSAGQGSALSEAEVAALHKEDIHAARAVVSLIFGILLIGVALYSVVLWTVAT